MILFIFIFSGCSTMYIPSPKNIPLFEEKGEVKIEVGTSTNSIFATGSYAFSKKYALIANSAFSFRYFSDLYDLGDLRSYSETTIFSGGVDVAHRSFEAGIGRYNLMKNSNRLLEIFTGVGYGDGIFENKDYHSRYFNGFIQTNTYRKSKNLEMGWSFYANYVYFNYKHPVYIRIPDEMRLKEEIMNSNFSLIQPGVIMFMMFGGEHLKFTIRNGINLAYPLSSNCPIKTNSSDTENTVFHISIGLSYRFKI